MDHFLHFSVCSETYVNVYEDTLEYWGSAGNDSCVDVSLRCSKATASITTEGVVNHVGRGADLIRNDNHAFSLCSKASRILPINRLPVQTSHSLSPTKLPQSTLT